MNGEERRRRIASRILIFEGALILVIALVQLAMAGSALALDQAVAGLLLMPVALTTIIAANGIAIGSEPAWRIAMINATTLLLLPFVLAAMSLLGPARSLMALAPAIALSLVGISMVWPLLWVRSGSE